MRVFLQLQKLKGNKKDPEENSLGALGKLIKNLIINRNNTRSSRIKHSNPVWII